MNKETIERIAFEIVMNNRKAMVKLIIELAGDEMENRGDLIELAQKSKLQLRHSLNNLLSYYL